jgi:hypothetical protein
MDLNEPGVVSTAVACQLLMLTAPRLDQLEKLGWIKRLAPNRWRVVDLVQGYIKFLKDEERRTSKTATLGRMQEAKAQQIEMRIAREAAKLIPIEFMDDYIMETAGPLKSDLDGVPAMFTRDLAQRDRLGDILDGVLNRMSDRFAAKGAELLARAKRKG